MKNQRGIVLRSKRAFDPICNRRILAVIAGICLAAPFARGDVTLTNLVSFNGANGAIPYAGLVQGTDGNFYGTTTYGGAFSNASFTIGAGTVFRLTPSGVLTTLSSFYGTNGALPIGVLVEGADGNFYGTTANGGAYTNAPFQSGGGTVFRITPSGELTLLVSFNPGNGIGPWDGLALGTDGNFYGTTRSGGSFTNATYPYGAGTIFRMTPAGELTTLVSFAVTNGAFPFGGLVQGSDGNLYGTASDGGSFVGNYGEPQRFGTVFKATTNGVLTTLVQFSQTNGYAPECTLVEGDDGDFYGTTLYGGTHLAAYNYGIAFKMSPSGELVTLAEFDRTNGATVNDGSGFAKGADGYLYGTTLNGGGTSDPGTIFTITPDGRLLSLFTFASRTIPVAVTAGSDDTFYGVSQLGGAFNLGAIFHLSFTGPPALLVQPANQTAAIGGDAHFRVYAPGAPPLTYQWQFNGTNLMDATNALLALTNLDDSKTGAYSIIGLVSRKSG